MLRWMLLTPTTRSWVRWQKGQISSPQRWCDGPKWTPIGRQRQLRTANITSVVQPAAGGRPQPLPSFLTEESRLRARHLLRALLRESSYLPLDPFARQWTARHILSRFRTYQSKVSTMMPMARFGTLADSSGWEERFRAATKQARKGLADLRRANEGERGRLVYVLSMAYGRVGKRRRELLTALTKGVRHAKEPHSGAKAVQETPNTNPTEKTATTADKKPQPIHNPASKSDTLPLDLNLPPPLAALLSSQIRNSPPEFSRRNPKTLTPSIPAYNSWQQPMPAVRIENKRTQLYAYLLARAQPPLPVAEFERLEQFAKEGGAEIDIPMMRSGREKTNERSGSGALEAVVQFGKVPNRLVAKTRGVGKGHTLTPRFLRRAYRDVFVQCCYMERDAEKEEWRVVWGQQVLAGLHKRGYETGDAVEMATMDDEVGHVLDEPDRGLKSMHS